MNTLIDERNMMNTNDDIIAIDMQQLHERAVLSQEQLSAVLNLSKSTIRRWSNPESKYYRHLKPYQYKGKVFYKTDEVLDILQKMGISAS